MYRSIFISSRESETISNISKHLTTYGYHNEGLGSAVTSAVGKLAKTFSPDDATAIAKADDINSLSPLLQRNVKDFAAGQKIDENEALKLLKDQLGRNKKDINSTQTKVSDRMRTLDAGNRHTLDETRRYGFFGKSTTSVTKNIVNDSVMDNNPAVKSILSRNGYSSFGDFRQALGTSRAPDPKISNTILDLYEQAIQDAIKAGGETQTKTLQETQGIFNRAFNGVKKLFSGKQKQQKQMQNMQQEIDATKQGVNELRDNTQQEIDATKQGVNELRDNTGEGFDAINKRLDQLAAEITNTNTATEAVKDSIKTLSETAKSDNSGEIWKLVLGIGGGVVGVGGIIYGATRNSNNG